MKNQSQSADSLLCFYLILSAGKREMRVYNQRLHDIRYDCVQLCLCGNKADQVKCPTQTKRETPFRWQMIVKGSGSSHHKGKQTEDKTWDDDDDDDDERPWEDRNRRCVWIGLQLCVYPAPRKTVSSQLRRQSRRGAAYAPTQRCVLSLPWSVCVCVLFRFVLNRCTAANLSWEGELLRAAVSTSR